MAVTNAPLPSLAWTEPTPAGESTYAVTGTVLPSASEAPTSGDRRKTDGPAAAVGASATPRNSVFAAAVASTVAADGENEAAEPFGSVSVTSWVGVVTARLTELPVTFATTPKAPGTSTSPAEAHVVPFQRYLSIVPPRAEPSAM